jgi:predicted O-methyltransferase YrrM
LNKFFRALKDPVRSCAIAWRRIFPFGIKPADPEAYRIGSWSYGKAQRTDLLALFPNASSTNIKIIRAGDRRKNLSLEAQELFALCVMVSALGAKRIIEIGTSDGNTTVNLVANAGSGAAITTIDLPTDWKGEYSIAVPETLNNVTCRNEVGRQFRNTVYETSITQILGDSAEIDFSVLGAPFDFAFIDGCHFYKYVRSDTEKCEQSMRDGGVIVWHDYGMIYDVSRAVDEWSAKRGVKVNVISATRLAFARLPKKNLESS